MSVTIGPKGLVETKDGSKNLTVEGTLSITSTPTGVTPGPLVQTTITTSGSAQTITGGGYYTVSCPFTGTLPSPTGQFGSVFMFVGTGGSGIQLTGSAYATGKSLFTLPTGVVSYTTGSWGSTQVRGTKCSLEDYEPSVCVMCDGRHYFPLFATGSLQLTGIDV
jgi:hypothetical protein